MRIEKAFAKQLPNFIGVRTRFIETGVKANYYSLAKYLTMGPPKDVFNYADPISYLRAKVYLQVYFGETFDNLQQEIEKELQKQPDKDILRALLQLLNLKKS